MLTKEKIKGLFIALNAQLEKRGVSGEVYLAGGAVMCLAYDARPSTKDIDAVFLPQKIIREEARRMAEQEGVEEDWLNDAVKGYMSSKSAFSSYMELSHLKIFVPLPEYLLAMKCFAMRIGFEFHDEQDVRYLLRYLNIDNYGKALEIITQYYPIERLPQKTLYALQEMLDDTK